MDRKNEFENAARAHSATSYNPTRGYRKTSVYDPIMPTGNGFGTTDRERLLPGDQMLPPVNGSSLKSYQLSSWLR